MIEVKDTGFAPGMIIVPTGVTARFVEFWDRLTMLYVPEGTGYIRTSGPGIAMNRNNGIREMKKHGGEWAFFLDDDHEFDADTLLHLLGRQKVHPEIGALCSLYVKKIPPYAPVLAKRVWKVNENTRRIESFTWAEIADAMVNHDGLLKVVAAGGSGLLVRWSVLEEMVKLPRPWFSIGDDQEDSSGDDVEFCMNLKAAGFDIYADLTKPIGHTTPVTITPAWHAVERAWFLRFKFGQRGFDLPAKNFHP